MTTIKRAREINFSANQMYDLVNDIASYREFVPWCKDSEVWEASDVLREGRLTFVKGGLEKSFTTINRLEPTEKIHIQLKDGPFKHLKGYWHFKALSESRCLVVLDLDFEFSSGLVAMMFGPVFTHIANTLVDVFCDQAAVRYEEKQS